MVAAAVPSGSGALAAEVTAPPEMESAASSSQQQEELTFAEILRRERQATELYVSNVGTRRTREQRAADIAEFFEGCGEIVEINQPNIPRRATLRDFLFVKFSTAEAAAVGISGRPWEIGNAVIYWYNRSTGVLDLPGRDPPTRG